MKFWLTYLFISTLMYCAGQSDFPYEFAVEHRAYIPLDNPINLTTEPGWDSARYTIHFPFEFHYMGTEVDSLYSFQHSADLMMAEGQMFLPFHTLIRDRSITDSTEISLILYQVIEEDSGDVLVVEYNNIGFLDNIFMPVLDAGHYLNFQLRFYEFSNKIEICFGKKYIWNPVYLHAGLPIVFSNSVTSVDPLEFDSTWYLTGFYTNPTVASGDSATLTVNWGPEPEPEFIWGMIADSTEQNLDSLVYSFTPIDQETAVEMPRLDKFQIYPNPATDRLTIKRMDSDPQVIRIFNVAGMQILSAKIIGNIAVVDISPLQADMYFLEINGLRQKFIREER